MFRRMFSNVVTTSMVVISCFLIIESLKTGLKEKVILHRMLAQCPNVTAPGKFVDVKIDTYEKGKTFLTLSCELYRDIKEISKITLKVTRCQSYTDPESCEFYYKFLFRNICQMMEMKNQVWSPVIEMIMPQDYRKCPFKKGIFGVANATMDPNSLATIIPGFEAFYWKLQADLYEGKARVACILYGGEVATIKVQP